MRHKFGHKYGAWMIVAAWFLVVTLVGALNAAVAQDAPSESGASTAETQVQQPEGVLKIEEQTKTEIEGVYGGSGSVVEFAAEQVGEGDGQTSEMSSDSAGGVVSSTDADAVQVAIEVNGKALEVTADLNQETVAFDSNGQALDQEDKQALVGLYNELGEDLAPKLDEIKEQAQQNTAEAEALSEEEAKAAEEGREPPSDTSVGPMEGSTPQLENPLTPQEDQLFRTTTFLAEAPVGVPLQSQETDIPAGDPEEVPESQQGENAPDPNASGPTKPADSQTQGQTASSTTGETTAGDLLLSYTAAESSEETCEEAKELGDIQLAASACSWYDNDTWYGMPYWFSCRTMPRWNQHDAWYCMWDSYDWTGPGTPYCRGGCGAGCGTGWRLYTQDCLDHDVAVEWLGYWNGYTYDEFTWTQDDYWWRFYYWYACYAYR